MTKHITLILILASLLTSCQRRELVGNLRNMRTEESRPAAVAEWCFCPRCALLRRQGVEEAFRVYLLSEDGETFDFRE